MKEYAITAGVSAVTTLVLLLVLQHVAPQPVRDHLGVK